MHFKYLESQSQVSEPECILETVTPRLTGLKLLNFVLGTNGPVNIYYGIGGCLALPAQNGVNVDSATFASSLKLNYHLPSNSGYGQNQCLRFATIDGHVELLPFGVSVCRSGSNIFFGDQRLSLKSMNRFNNDFDFSNQSYQFEPF